MEPGASAASAAVGSRPSIQASTSSMEIIDVYKRQGEAGGGVVGDAAEVIADLLARHDLHIPCLLDADVGIEALICLLYTSRCV